jgi:hypothetical protein
LFLRSLVVKILNKKREKSVPKEHWEYMWADNKE